MKHIEAEYAIAQLNAMQPYGDTEVDHGRADDLLCQVLDACGRDDVANAFRAARERCIFWYA